MQGDFSFCGVSVASLGVRYAPDMSGTYVHFETWNPHVQTFEGFHGGLYYGETVQPKEFKLRCYFEDDHINEGVLDKLQNLFRRGRMGRLVFNTRPWLYYIATTASIDYTQLRNYRNGFLVITMRAYYPFARCDYDSLDALEAAGFDVTDPALLNTASFLRQDSLPQTAFENVSANKILYLYNAGTVRAPLAIALSGEAGDGVTITNLTTGQACRFVAFTGSGTTSAGKEILCDAMNGKTVLTDGDTAELAFTFHDYGFLELEPCSASASNLELNAQGNVVSGYDFTEDDVGKCLLVPVDASHSEWFPIRSVVDGTATLDDDGALSSPASFTSGLVTLNQIAVTLSAGASLDTLRFSYKPTFR